MASQICSFFSTHEQTNAPLTHPENHEIKVLRCLDSQLQSQAPAHPVLSALVNHSRWRSIAYNLATIHLGSALSFYVSRHGALLKHNLPPVPFFSRHFVQAILIPSNTKSPPPSAPLLSQPSSTVSPYSPLTTRLLPS